MRPTKTPRGLTLVEAMIAMAIMLVGATGLAAMTRQGVRLNSDGRRMTRAAAIAQDLANQIETWDYDDPRLANTSTGNDADFGDKDFAFEAASAPAADHGEADLTAGGQAWLGLPTADLQPGDYERFWNVAELDDTNANGIPDLRRVAVIVRWPQGSGFRRVVLFLAKVNPAAEERL